MKRNYFRWMIALMLILCVLPVAVAAEDEGPVPQVENPCANGHVGIGAEQIVTPATCTQPGQWKKVCTCGAEFYGTINPPGHVLATESITPATCTGTGTEIKKCSTCQNTFTYVLPASGHSFKAWEVTKPATCTGTGSQTRGCDNCDGTFTEVIPALGHTYTEWTVTTQATCTDTGSRQRSCTVCTGGPFVEVIPALGHDYTEWETLATVTCTVNGKRTRSCKTCLKDFPETVIAPGHSLSAWSVVTPATCTTAGQKVRTCSACDGVFPATIDPLNHSWDAGQVTTAATCHSAGVKTYTCGNAGCTVKTKTEAIPATGAHRHSIMLSNSEYHYQYCWNEGCKYVTTGYHDWSRWRVARAATEEKDGLLRKDCLWCNQKKWSSYKYSDNPPPSDAMIVHRAKIA